MKIYNPTGFSSSLTGSFSGSVKGTLTATGNIVPDVSGAYDIGSTEFPFKDLYITQNSLKFINDSTGEEIGRISVNSNTGDIKLLNTKNLTEEEKANLTAENVGAEALSPVSASAIWVSQSISPGHTNTSIGHTNQKFHTVHTQYVSASSTAISGDLTVGGKVTAQEFHTEFVSASILYDSGSTKFGDTADDIHQITGSLIVSGGIVGDVFSSNNFTAFSQGINIEPGDTAQSTFRFDSNKFRLFNGNVGELFSVTETGEATLQIPVGSGDPTLNIIATSAASGTGNPALVLKRSNEETLKLEGVANVEGRISAVAAGVGNLTFYTGDGFSAILDRYGNLGIGTNNPSTYSSRLTVVTDNTANHRGLTIFTQGGLPDNTNFYPIGIGDALSTNNSFFIKYGHISDGSVSNSFNIGAYGNDDIFTILAGGNIGVGTNNPNTKFHVQNGTGDEVTDFKIGTGGQVIISRNHALSPSIESNFGSGASILRFYSDSTLKTNISTGNSYFNGGSLLVGATAKRDQEKFSVVGNTLNYLAEIRETGTGGAENSGLLIYYPSSAPNSRSKHFLLNADNTATKSYLSSDGGAYFSGNVGVGVTSTIAKLTLPLEEETGYKIAFKSAGTTHAGISTVDQSGAGLYIGANSYVNASGVVTYSDSAYPSSGIYFDGWYGNCIKFYGGTSGVPTERMRIDSSGYIGLGNLGQGASVPLHIYQDSSDVNGNNDVMLILQNTLYNSTQSGDTFENKIALGWANHYAAGISAYKQSTNITGLKFYTEFGYNVDEERMRIDGGGNVGINDTSPSAAKLSVVSSDSSVPTLRISNEANGGNNFVFQRWAYIRGTDAYRLDLTQDVSSGLVQYRFDLTNNSTTYNSNLVLDRGNVGIGVANPPERLYVNGRIRTPEGQIGPTFYIARNYANAWGSAAGYDDIQVGGIINLRDHSVGNLLAFMHGTMSPIVNGGESMSWNAFRILFRWTRSSNSYVSATVGFKVAGYFYSGGWYDASPEFSVTGGTDSDRGPRWGASPWLDYSSFNNSTDVPGIGLKLHSSSESGITLRIHAAYIQYKY